MADVLSTAAGTYCLLFFNHLNVGFVVATGVPPLQRPQSGPEEII